MILEMFQDCAESIVRKDEVTVVGITKMLYNVQKEAFETYGKRNWSEK